MIDLASKWICESFLLLSGFVYVYTIEKRVEKKQVLFLLTVVYFVFFAGVNHLSDPNIMGEELVIRLGGFLFLAIFLHAGRVLSWRASFYYAIWAFLTWQLLYQLCLISWHMGIDFWTGRMELFGIFELLVFGIGLAVGAVTIGRTMPEQGHKKIGVRQLSLAGVTLVIFQLLVLTPKKMPVYMENHQWTAVYLTQILLGVVLYLENELFKKSEIRQELELMDILWKKNKEQYQLAKENIAVINQKVHDLKHQIRAIRNASREDIDHYLKEVEESVQIYESIIQTGNEVLDTILTEKSLYCQARGIQVSCVADGSQMKFLNTVDLYAILGNAIDNAIEEVEQFQEKEKRQIDVLIYRQQQFLAINIINPMKTEQLQYEEGLPVTTKTDKRMHGFGLRSMKYILKKYDGFLNVAEEDGLFTLMMLIPVPESEEKKNCSV